MAVSTPLPRTLNDSGKPDASVSSLTVGVAWPPHAVEETCRMTDLANTGSSLSKTGHRRHSGRLDHHSESSLARRPRMIRADI